MSSVNDADVAATVGAVVQKEMKKLRRAKSVSRKPYIMTDARKAAFEKCRAARMQKLQAKKQTQALN